MSDTSKFPWPEGTLVMGVLPSGMPVRKTCENHIFITMGDPKPANYTEKGFIQPAKCLVCLYVTQPIDAEFWHRKADGMDLAGLSGELHAQIEGYLEALDTIGNIMVGAETTKLRAID